MAESKATAPDFVLNIDVDMEEAVDLRKRLKAAAAEGQPVPSFNDFVVKASALALLDFPRANGAYRDGKFELYSRVNVGVAVAGQDALVVPTVFDADKKSLGQIAKDARALAERVRAGAITPPELSSGTFTVSNLGMFGIQSFVAVINPPQAAILAVGAMQPTRSCATARSSCATSCGSRSRATTGSSTAPTPPSSSGGSASGSRTRCSWRCSGAARRERQLRGVGKCASVGGGVRNVNFAALAFAVLTKRTPEVHNCTPVAQRRTVSTKCTRAVLQTVRVSSYRALGRETRHSAGPARPRRLTTSPPSAVDVGVRPSAAS